MRFFARDDTAAANRAHLRGRGLRADRAQARHGPRHAQPRPALRGRPLRDRSRRRAADVLRASASPCGRPIPATRTATGRRSTSPRSREAAILVVASLLIAWRAILRLTGHAPGQVDPKWYAFVVIGAVIVIDASRAIVSYRAARRYRSAALQANALHFAERPRRLDRGPDRARSRPRPATTGPTRPRRCSWRRSSCWPPARLMRVNVDVLMDRVPSEAEAAARRGDRGDRARRSSCGGCGCARPAGRQFADVVIGVPPGAAVGQGHAAADAVEEAVQRALPGSDVVVHVEPQRRRGGAARARARGRAAGPARARDAQRERRARRAAARRSRCTSSSRASCRSRRRTRWRARSSARSSSRSPEVDSVQTHLEPLARGGRGATAPDDATPTGTSSSGSCARRPAQRRASCASSAPTTACSPT